MKIDQVQWTRKNGWEPVSPGLLGQSAQLVLAFGSTGILEKQEWLVEIKRAYPAARIMGCSTAGEITVFSEH